ncbi:polyphosphate glucokinase [Streptomyces mashuensis]|uniref:Polyphosphate glucokinase n=1 Tax=Streptomyces mashuensis TaxID=33904 RepID=A0A919B705_9ACTN|nr:ROK family protein [Streptomyces mashuensis]GHF60686.1 polyphosphate glucokinase [Streptomyces mashuensis]
MAIVTEATDTGSAAAGTPRGVPAVLGIDIGGSGIKGAPVDLARGELTAERFKVLTPHPATPEAVAACVREVADHFGHSGHSGAGTPVGVTFPGVVVGGETRTAANVDKSWIGRDAGGLLSERLGGAPVTLLNDADAAGLAEMSFGAGRGRHGTVIVLTFGTGIGSAVFSGGTLVPNTELGHLELQGHDAEKRASTRVKEDEDLSWSRWAKRVSRYLAHVEMLFSPELFVIGGGVSRKAEKFLPLIEGVRAGIVPARLENNAGIVGAAMAAAAAAGAVPCVAP